MKAAGALAPPAALKTLSRKDLMLPGELNQRDTIDNRAAVNNANGGIIQATISIIRNPGAGATA